jgi:hypothetical protein
LMPCYGLETAKPREFAAGERFLRTEYVVSRGSLLDLVDGRAEPRQVTFERSAIVPRGAFMVLTGKRAVCVESGVHGRCARKHAWFVRWLASRDDLER